MQKKTIKQTDGTEVVITTNDSNEILKRGYNAEDDITKPHKDIITKVVDIDLEIQSVLDDIELDEE